MWERENRKRKSDLAKEIKETDISNGMYCSLIQMEEMTVLANKSSDLQNFFAIKEIESEPSSKFSICRGLLTAIHIDEFLKKIRSLSENIEINRDIPFEGELVKPGTVYVYEIYVVYERYRFHIT